MTVSSFMFGLGFGGLLGLKFAPNIARPLFYLGLIEIFVAIYSFLLPKLLFYIDGKSATGDLTYGAWINLEIFTVLLLMTVPATLLGCGFSLFLQALKKTNSTLGIIYGSNTLGGVLGVLLPLILLPTFGWIVSLKLIAIFGFIVGASFVLISFVFPRAEVESKSLNFGSVKGALFAYAGIGFASLILQIAWTRFYGMIFLRSEYVLAVLIAVFLIGIAFGSFLAPRISKLSILKYFPFLVAFFALLSVWLIEPISALNGAAHYTSMAEALFSQGILLFIVTAPVTFLLGLWFPLLAKHMDLRLHQSVILYSVNSLGAALGALAAAFVLIPVFGVAKTIGFAAVIFLLVNVVWLRTRAYVFLCAFLIPLILFLSFPPEVKNMMPGVYSESKELSIYEDAITTTNVVQKTDGERLLLNDLQRMDASTSQDAIHAQRNQSRLPYLLHPEPDSVLFLGYGTGISTSPLVDLGNLKIDAVELSQGAIEAASNYFALANLNAAEKVNIIRDDARRFLKMTEKRYDLIIGDLFHPDLVGRGNLLSMQQFMRAKNVLTHQGVFVQWLALNQFDEKGLNTVLNTFAQVFENNWLFLDGFRLALVGFATSPVEITTLDKKFIEMDAEQRAKVLGNETMFTWLGRWVGIAKVNSQPIQNEWSPVLEFELPNLRFSKIPPVLSSLSWVMKERPNLESAIQALNVPDYDVALFEQGYNATGALAASILYDIRGDTMKSYEWLKIAYEANPGDRWVSFRYADALFLSDSAGLQRSEVLAKVLTIRPDHLDALLEIYSVAETESARAELSSKIRSLEPYRVF